MKKQIEQVAEFQRAFKSPVEDKPCFPNFDRLMLRKKLLEEEVRELSTAMVGKDSVECLDGITDCMYILIGTAHELGLAKYLEAAFDEVHRSNMSKLDEEGNPIFREDGKVMKSRLYSRPNLKGVLENEGENVADVHRYIWSTMFPDEKFDYDNFYDWARENANKALELALEYHG
jgi:predicted HAD superfamily Cof-like phosphohydrolase